MVGLKTKTKKRKRRRKKEKRELDSFELQDGGDVLLEKKPVFLGIPSV